jgi:hypothetical protein
LDTNVSGTLDNSEITATAYACNGTPGPGVTWVEVTSSAVQAESNTGYYVNSDAQAVVTLPASPAVGDVIHVSGLGTGGWKIAQNPGQYISTRTLSGGRIGANWVERNSAQWWASLASSADGTKLFAVADEQVFVSTDYGVVWHSLHSLRFAIFVACSSDGTTLVLLTQGLPLAVSNDSGVTWTMRESDRFWSSAAVSADGTRLAAVVRGGYIYTSDDSGVTWTERATDSIRDWTSVASSADGTRLVAAVDQGQIYSSTDSGLTWTARESNRAWRSVASSADGTRLVAAAELGQIYTSTDAGVTWTARENNRSWRSVASSADGTRLAAAAHADRIYTSTDSGVTWNAQGPSQPWLNVASSSDGTRLVAAGIMTPIFTSTLTPTSTTTVGTAGSISGAPEHAISLQYAGNGRFIVLSYAGTFAVE